MPVWSNQLVSVVDASAANLKLPLVQIKVKGRVDLLAANMDGFLDDIPDQNEDMLAAARAIRDALAAMSEGIDNIATGAATGNKVDVAYEALTAAVAKLKVAPGRCCGLVCCGVVVSGGVVFPLIAQHCSWHTLACTTHTHTCKHTNTRTHQRPWPVHMIADRGGGACVGLGRLARRGGSGDRDVPPRPARGLQRRCRWLPRQAPGSRPGPRRRHCRPPGPGASRKHRRGSM